MRNVWWICRAWPPPLRPLEASSAPSYGSSQRPPATSPSPKWSPKETPSHHYFSLLTGLLARAAARPAIREAIRCNWGPWEQKVKNVGKKIKEFEGTSSRPNDLILSFAMSYAGSWVSGITERYMEGLAYEQYGLWSIQTTIIIHWTITSRPPSMSSVLLTCTPARRPDRWDVGPTPRQSPRIPSFR